MALNPEAARSLLELRFSPEMQDRIDQLAEKCNEGTLTDYERAEYEAYVRIIHLLGVLHARVRAALSEGDGA